MRLKTAPTVLAICALLALSGCSRQSGETVASNESSSSTATVPAEAQKEEVSMSVTATLNGHDFEIELVDNDTARAFAGMLPLSGTLSELNGNEKYLMVSDSLPSNPSNPGTIEAGDVMLYQDDYIVVFYETHPSSYAYTRIGKIADVSGLSSAVGSGSVEATFTAR